MTVGLIEVAEAQRAGVVVREAVASPSDCSLPLMSTDVCVLCAVQRAAAVFRPFRGGDSPDNYKIPVVEDNRTHMHIGLGSESAGITNAHICLEEFVKTIGLKHSL